MPIDTTIHREHSSGDSVHDRLQKLYIELADDLPLYVNSLVFFVRTEVNNISDEIMRLSKETESLFQLEDSRLDCSKSLDTFEIHLLLQELDFLLGVDIITVGKEKEFFAIVDRIVLIAASNNQIWAFRSL